MRGKAIFSPFNPLARATGGFLNEPTLILIILYFLVGILVIKKPQTTLKHSLFAGLILGAASKFAAALSYVVIGIINAGFFSFQGLFTFIVALFTALVLAVIQSLLAGFFSFLGGLLFKAVRK